MNQPTVPLFALLLALVCLVPACAKPAGQQPAEPPVQACTKEAKLCPDGSAVGRTGPNCEFAPCPEAEAEAAPAPAP